MVKQLIIVMANTAQSVYYVIIIVFWAFAAAVIATQKEILVKTVLNYKMFF